MKRLFAYFTNGQKLLWVISVTIITVTFIVFDRTNRLNYIASLIGVTSLLFATKGNPVSLVLMIVFSMVYGYISYTFAYYGEMITYLGMTLPMSVWSLVMWLKNPYRSNRAQVTVNPRLGKKERLWMALLTVAVTIAFYFILRALGTANLIPSTVSVATSFAAVYLTGRRSPYYAVAYALNDVVLIVLWVLASIEDQGYIGVATNFAVFLAGDIYGFISWKRLEKSQQG